MEEPLLFWIAFNLFVLAMLAIDMGALSRKPREIGMREAMARTAGWMVLAMAFCAGIALRYGHVKATEFATGYVLEQALSVDNMFIFLLIFNYFRVPHAYQHKVLFWGILGALVLRMAFIFAGVSIIRRFHWAMYGFGAFLVYTGFKLLRKESEELHPEKSLALRAIRRVIPMTAYFEGSRFFTTSGGYLAATPLFVVLLFIETTDVIFAVDSIPAVLAVSKDPFIVYTSNVFAILGLRSLYFALAGAMGLFHRLNYGLAGALVFIGLKMLVADWIEVPTIVSLAGVLGCVGASIAASLIWPEAPKK